MVEITIPQWQPMKRDSADFMAGFQRGYAEALNDVLLVGADAMDSPEALRLIANILEDPIGRAKQWVSEDDGSER